MTSAFSILVKIKRIPHVRFLYFMLNAKSSIMALPYTGRKIRKAVVIFLSESFQNDDFSIINDLQRYTHKTLTYSTKPGKIPGMVTAKNY